MTRQTARQRGYGLKWEKARAGFLRSHPWCSWCEREGKLRPAVHVHHSTPHKGNSAIFWNRCQWVGLCEEHHNRDAQQVETRGYASRIDADGFPSDPAHPFNQGEADQPEDTNARQRPTSSIGGAIAAGGGRSKVKRFKGVGPAGSSRTELVPFSNDFRGAR